MCRIYKKYRYSILFLVLIVFILVLELKTLFLLERSYNLSPFRKMEISTDVLEQLVQEKGYGSDGFFQILTEKMLHADFKLAEKKQLKGNSHYIKWLSKDSYNQYIKRYQALLKDIKCFPVLKDKEGIETISFQNSWFMSRNYGGKRFHEGTDIMTSNNIRGYFDIVSMTDGVVEQIGWLEKGGYRVGIRSENGGYFYYAHLYEFARGLCKGSIVKAGDKIGTMGDSGYSKIEGTIGNFDVHLHMGIYLNENGKEMSVNPYYILLYFMKLDGL